MRLLTLLFLFLFSPALAIAGPLEDGRAAIERKDYPAAITILQPMADHGSAPAQFLIGGLHALGYGFKQDLSEAAVWWLKAANQGYVEAQKAVGVFYETPDENGRVDKKKSMEWYLKAGAQGDSWSLTRIGVMYLQGEGVPMDAMEAEKWFRKDAELGHYGGQFHLGELYLQGTGVKQDNMEAYYWFSLAAKQKEAFSKFIDPLLNEAKSKLTADQIELVRKRVAKYESAPTPPAETKQ